MSIQPVPAVDLPLRIGPYRVQEVLHRGRFSWVYRVREAGLDRELVLKTLSPDARGIERARATRRLRREAALRSLDLPGLLPLYRAGRGAAGDYLVGPWLGGGTLTTRWPEGAPLDEALAAVEAAATALDALHGQGWVHGDLAPNNLVFDVQGRLRLVDFGSSVPLGSRWRRYADGTSRWPFTRLTGAPEVAAGAPVDGRSDQYALAVLAYFLVTGTWPYVAEDGAGLEALHRSGSLVRPSERRLGLGPALDEVFLRALAKAPADRFPSCGTFAGAFREAVAGAPAPARKEAEPALAQFLTGLSPSESATFRAMLSRLDIQAGRRFTRDLRARVAPMAALEAAEEAGLLGALGRGPQTSEALAAAVGLPTRPVARICGLLRAEGFLERREGTWVLLSPLAELYQTAACLGTDPAHVRHAVERWGHLPSWLRTQEPYLSMDGDSDGEGYAESAGTLGHTFQGAAADLAGDLQEHGVLCPGGQVLDLGAGSAVWSLAMARACPEVGVTALDRPKVLAQARARAEAAGLSDRLRLMPGGWLETALPEGAFDLALAAQFCHVLAPEELTQLFAKVRCALRPGGRLLVLDTIPERLEEAPSAVLRYDLDLALRTQRGGVHDLQTYQAALQAAGFSMDAFWAMDASEGAMRALVARPMDGA